MDIRKFLNLLCVVVMASVIIVSCEEEYVFKAPSFKVSRKIVQLSSKGDTSFVYYNLQNPLEDQDVEYHVTHPERYEIQIDTMRTEMDSILIVKDTIWKSTNRDWLKIIVDELDASVAFIAEKNVTDTMGREATVTLSYSDLAPIDIYVSQTFWVAPLEILSNTIYDTKAVLHINTNDKHYTWSCSVIKSSLFNADWTDDDVYERDIARYQAEANAAGKTFEEYMAEVFNSKTSVQKGENEAYVIDRLSPSTEYVLYLYGMNASGSRTSAIYYDTFTTLPKGQTPPQEEEPLPQE